MPGADTIAAIATAPGRGGIGIVRVSGPAVPRIAQALIGRTPGPRRAAFAAFRDARSEPIDHGIVIFYPAPRSYTGEDVLELHGHGGPVVLALLLERCLKLGARLAEPGEFTRRALLNDKLDLAQAEAVADLIDAASERAARSAMRSLTGEFSRRVAALQNRLTDIRVLLEASFDFPEEELDVVADAGVAARLEALARELDGVLAAAGTGKMLRDGIEVALIGPPNVGKSSLINALSKEDVAIVTPLPGTTRDLVRASVIIAGIPVHLTDTAGLRATNDMVETIGIERARAAAHKADAVLLISDASAPSPAPALEGYARVVHVHNKIDLVEQPPRRRSCGGEEHVWISATQGTGIDLLEAALLDPLAGTVSGEGAFSARQRHLDALRRVRDRIERARARLDAPEFAAEELRLAQDDLSVLTGAHAADDLLGEIFARFCIGK
jgi:tRNA modification GTPase